MKVRKISSVKRKNMLLNKYWKDGIFQNPVLDADGNWIITNEQSQADLPGLEWLKTLEEIDHNPIQIELN